MTGETTAWAFTIPGKLRRCRYIHCFYLPPVLIKCEPTGEICVFWLGDALISLCWSGYWSDSLLSAGVIHTSKTVQIGFIRGPYWICGTADGRFSQRLVLAVGVLPGTKKNDKASSCRKEPYDSHILWRLWLPWAFAHSDQNHCLLLMHLLSLGYL